MQQECAIRRFYILNELKTKFRDFYYFIRRSMMINISKLPSIDHEVLLDTQIADKENWIKKKTCIVAKKIFSYLSCNQIAISTALWSFVFIQVGIAAAELATKEPLYDLERCKTLVCHHWNNNTEARTNFSPFVRFRCNSSHPHYAPFSFVDQCMHDLCEYMTNIGQNLSECTQYSSNFLNKAWNKICPKKKIKNWSSSTEAEYLDRCFIKLCNQYKILQVIIPNRIQDWCANKNFWILRDSLKNSYKELASLDSPINEWTPKEFLKTTLKGVEDIFAGVSSMLITTIELQSSEILIPMDTIDSFKDSLEKILHITSENIKYLVNEVNVTEEVLPKLTRKNLLQLADNMQDFCFYDHNIIQILHEQFKKSSMSGYEIMPKSKEFTILASHLDKWHGTYCFYNFPESLLCRLPLPVTNSIIDEPLVRINALLKPYRNSLCFFLSEYEETWCNFLKIFDFMCYKEKGPTTEHCYMDPMILDISLTRRNYYKFTFTGDSCKETFIIDKRC